MANRKITEMPNIEGGSIVDEDLLTVVAVNEADPSLRNKKLQFDELVVYLDQYFQNTSGNTFSGDIIVGGNATISGLTTTSGLIVTHAATVSGLTVQNDAIVSGTISGDIVSGDNSFFNQSEIQTGTVTTLTGTTFTYSTGVVTSYFSGAVITGDTVNALNFSTSNFTAADISGGTITGVSGLYENLTAQNITLSGVTVTGQVVVSGELSVSGLFTASGAIVTGTLTGNTITGNSISGTSGVFTYLSGTSITGDLISGTSGVYSRISGATITGNNISGTGGQFAHISGATITGNIVQATTITGVSGVYTNISGTSGVFTNITGTSIQANRIDCDTGVFHDLTAINMTFQGDQTISGNFTVIDDLTVSGGARIVENITGEANLIIEQTGFIEEIVTSGTISGATITGDLIEATTITGVSGVYTYLSGATITGDLISGTSGVYANLSGANITGDLISGTSGVYAYVSGASITGDLIEATTITGVSGIYTFLLGVTITGDFISGTSGVYANLSGGGITGDLISGTSGVFTYVSGTNVTGNTISGTSGVFTNLSGASITGDLISGTSGVFTYVSGTNVTGNTISGTSGVFTNLSGASITGELISGTSGVFTNVTGTTINSVTGSFTTGTFSNLRVTGTITGDIANFGVGAFGVSATETGYFPNTSGTAAVGSVDFPFASGVFTNLSGTTITGNTIQATSGVFVNGTFNTINISGVTTSTGIFASGTESAPSITFSGDLNTGIYSPLANEIGITTNGTGRLFVDSIGRVGIGTSNPTDKFDIVDTLGVSVRLKGGANDRAQWRTAVSDNGSAGLLQIDNFSGGSYTTNVTLLDNGNVGIGTSSPENLLHLAANNSAIGSNWSLASNLIRIEDSDTSQAGGQVIGGIVFEGRDADAPGVQAALMANSNSGTGGGQLRFYTAATSADLSGTEDPRLLIDGSGNVGIGTTSPLYKLQVAASGDSSIVLANETTNTDGQKRSLITKKSDNNLEIRATDSTLAAETIFSRAINNESARIDSSGNVGIGTGSTGGDKIRISSESEQPVRIQQPTNSISKNTSILLQATNSNGNSSNQVELVASANGSGSSESAFFLNVRASTDSFNSPGRVLTALGNGNVGIGTSSPSTELEVVATSPTIQARATANNVARLSLDSNRAASLLAGQIEGKWNGNTVSRINFVNGADGVNKDNGLITFNTSSSSSNPQERMLIDSSGNVGIGTSDPAYRLTVAEGNVTSVSAKATGDNTSARVARYIWSFDDGDGASINGVRATGSSASDVDLSFRTGGITNSEERMRIISNGNVGIGTSSPDAPLSVKAPNSAGSSQVFRVQKSNTDSCVFRIDLDPDANIVKYQATGNQDASHVFGTGGTTEQMRIDSNGNVGIGTSSPATALHISGTGVNDSRLTVDRSGVEGVVGIVGNNLLLSGKGSDGSNGGINFFTGGSEKVRIDSSGNVGIGLINPSDLLHVNGTANAKNFKATVYTITWSSSFALNPNNGETQFVVLGGNSTPTQSGWDNGESITLHIDDGSSRTITWTTLGVVWTGGSAPTLATSGDTVVQLWKAGNVIYGALVGEVA